jgi:hypothetical protein
MEDEKKQTETAAEQIKPEDIDQVRLADIVPRESSIRLPRKLFGIKRMKIYRIRPFSFRDKVVMLREYGAERFNKIISDANNIEFEILHFRILYELLEPKIGLFGIKEFKDFDDFQKYILGYKAEVDCLAAAIIARGVSAAALLSRKELKEILADIEKKKTMTPVPSTGETPSTH